MVIDFITTPIWKALGEETDRAIDAETALKRNSFADAEYVASEKMIYLSNGFGEVIDSIDCTDFIIDGMVENVTLNGNILTITFNTDAGKQNIDIDLTEFINPQNYYTKTETDNLVNSSFTSAVTYVDSEIVSAKADSKTYTDNAVNGVNEHILTFEKTTSIALNELKQEIEALKTRITALESK